jgi:Helix-hairpin-helix motif
MKRVGWAKLFLVFLLLGRPAAPMAQDGTENERRESMLETMAERQQSDPGDESYLQQMEFFRRHPVNLNRADQQELESLQLLNPLQVARFFEYRRLFGDFISIYELQAIPLWDAETIKSLLPYVVVRKDVSLNSALRERWKGGDRILLFRTGEVPEKSKGYGHPANPGDAYYEGSPQKILLQYGYNYKNLLQYGFTGEKDAGEQFFRGAQRAGFDFYSFHFFLKDMGIIKSLAIGDFTVNMGQGLLQWQSASFTKTASVLSIKKETALLRPYHSVGEMNFHRGAALTVHKKNWESTAFISFQKISSNAFTDSSQDNLFSSFQNSGYHRSPSENENRNNTGQWSAGGNFSLTTGPGQWNINAIFFHFSRGFQKRDEPYNHYAFSGENCAGYSINYSYTFRNLHVFGEAAIDRHGHPALIAGALASLGRNMDVSLLCRNISPAYQCLYAEAFTENASPGNEQGFYAGVSWRLSPFSRIDLYYDLYSFPWLKYRVDAPSRGRDYFIQWSFRPNRQWYLYTRFKNESKEINAEGATTGVPPLTAPIKKEWRLETGYELSRRFALKSRMEFVWRRTGDAPGSTGFLGLFEYSFHARSGGASLGGEYFETDDYDTRIYAYESDMLYSFSLPAYYGRGVHYYINIHQNLHALFRGRSRRPFPVTGSLRWSQTFYPGLSSIGTGLDEIAGNRKSEIKAQLIVSWP